MLTATLAIVPTANVTVNVQNVTTTTTM